MATSGSHNHNWLRIGAGVALLLAVLMVVLAFHHANEERRAQRDIKARVQAEMQRIEAEAKRMEREAGR
jgi:type VI protein secretion system component VasK